jgi:guanylyl transferase CofC like protein
MSLWAIIPIKPLNRAKTRLSEVLSPEQRYEFAATDVAADSYCSIRYTTDNRYSGRQP